MPFPLSSNLAGIAKGVALNGVLPDIVANTVLHIFTLLAEIPRSSSGSSVKIIKNKKELVILLYYFFIMFIWNRCNGNTARNC